MNSDSYVSSPVKLGAYRLQNRIAIASNWRSPTSERLFADEAISYYGNRASCGLIITEPTLVAPVDYLANYPGIYTRQQIRSWRSVTETVREKNGNIFLQLLYSREKKTATSHLDIANLFRIAAQNAIAAEFDGIEISLDLAGDRNLAKDLQLLLAIVEEVARVWDEDKLGIKLTAKSQLFALEAYSLTSEFYDLLDLMDFQNIAFIHLEDFISATFQQSDLAISWLKIIHAIYSGTLIIDCQNCLKQIRDIIAQSSTDMISFYNMPKVLL